MIRNTLIAAAMLAIGAAIVPVGTAQAMPTPILDLAATAVDSTQPVLADCRGGYRRGMRMHRNYGRQRGEGMRRRGYRY